MGKTDAFHMAKSGQIAICPATISCKLKESDGTPAIHGATKEEVTEKIAYYNTPVTHKLISSVPIDAVLKDKDSKVNKILKSSDVKATGFNYETAMSYAYARQMGLNTALLKKNGKWVALRLANQSEKINTKLAYDSLERAREAIKEQYDGSIDISKDPLDACRVVYVDSTGQREGIFVQTGGANTLDALRVDKGETRLIEIKRTHKQGSQAKQYHLGVNQDGSFEVRDSDIHEHLREEILKHNANDFDGNWERLNLTKKEGLYHFAHSYKQSGASELMYTDSEGKVRSIRLDRNTNIVAEEMEQCGFDCKMKIRMNLSAGKITKEGKQRFIKNESNIFKGNLENNKSLKFGQFEQKYMRNASGYVAIGHYKLPVKWEDRFSALDKDINVNDIKMYVPVLSGDVVNKYKDTGWNTLKDTSKNDV